ncbi:DUF3037 domain-containing protein [Phormidesmis sp. 146-35]
MVCCAPRKFLKTQIELDEQRLSAIHPHVDLETIRDHLAVIPLICAGGLPAGAIGQLPLRERFYWLVASRSTIIQTSRVHTGLCQDLPAVLDRLLDKMVRPSHDCIQ